MMNRMSLFALWLCAVLLVASAGAIDEADIDQLILDLAFENSQSRINLAKEIAEVGPAAKRAAPTLAAVLNDKDASVRAGVATALGAIGLVSLDSSLIPLRNLLADESHLVRVRAARSHWQLDEPAAALIPTLTKVVIELAPNTKRDATIEFSVRDNPAGIAIELLGEIGPEARPAVPTLLAAVDDPRLSIRFAAVDALGAIGPEANSAIKRLELALRDTKTYSYPFAHSSWCLSDNAAVALRRIGPASTSVLLAALEDRNERVRYNAANALGYLPASDEKVIPALVKLLDDQDAAVRATAAYALGRIGPKAAAAAPNLAARLNDKGEWTFYPSFDIGSTTTVGAHILAALKDISPEPKSIVPIIVQDLKKTRHVSGAMRETLQRLGPEAKEAVPVIEALLGDPDEGLAAAMALARIKPDHEGLLERLRMSLVDKRDDASVSAARGLGDLGRMASAALPDLYVQLEHQKEPSAKAIIAAAILKIDRSQRRAIVELARGLQEVDEHIRYWGQDEAAAVWSTLGKDAEPAIGRLIEGLIYDSPTRQWDEPRSRVRSAELLIDISVYRPELIDALIDMCESSGGRHRCRAADALGRIGPAAGRAVPAIVTLLADRDRHSSIDEPGDHAAPALGKIGVPAVPLLRTALKDDRPFVRQRAAQALGLVGRGAQPAAADLVSAVKEPNRVMRTTAAEALGRIGDTGDATLAALTDALTDKHLSVRVAAAAALGNLGPAARRSGPELSKLQNDSFELARSAAGEALRKIRSN